jgi:hypothetical protein
MKGCWLCSERVGGGTKCFSIEDGGKCVSEVRLRRAWVGPPGAILQVSEALQSHHPMVNVVIVEVFKVLLK